MQVPCAKEEIQRPVPMTKGLGCMDLPNFLVFAENVLYHVPFLLKGLKNALRDDDENTRGTASCLHTKTVTQLNWYALKAIRTHGLSHRQPDW